MYICIHGRTKWAQKNMGKRWRTSRKRKECGGEEEEDEEEEEEKEEVEGKELISESMNDLLNNEGCERDADNDEI